MIYDGHAYCFPSLRGDGGFDDSDEFRKHLQLAIASHFQPIWRSRDRMTGDNSDLIDTRVDRGFDALKDVQFRATSHGRFEWTIDGEDYFKQYTSPSVRDMAYYADDLVAEMDYAGIDMALLHRIPYLGIGNDFVADCCRRFPDRLQGLAHVEEWLIRPDMDNAIKKVKLAVNEQGLHGIQFIPDQLPLYGQTEDWDSDDFKPFWNAVASLGVPLFITPSYSSLAMPGFTDSRPLVTQLKMINRWMNLYPGVTVVFTHGLGWRLFIKGDRLSIPDDVYNAIPDNANFHIQLLFAIFLGGIWDYPMVQVRPTMQELVARVGPERLIWGTDMPMVMRFYTYRQNLDHIRICSDFLPADQTELIIGSNMARLMGVYRN